MSVRDGLFGVDLKRNRKYRHSCLLTTTMSLLRAVQIGAASRRAAFSASTIVRSQSTATPQTGVEVADAPSSEITTTVPAKEAVTADAISGAPGSSSPSPRAQFF